MRYFSAPGNCIIASGMIIFYKTPLQNILGQLVNQSFNSTVNYSNAPVPKFVPQDFAVAAGSACAAAYGMNKMASRFAIPLLARLVPFAAVCVANGINLPYMRRDEIISGMPLEDENGNVVGHSPKIGKEAIIKVCKGFLKNFEQKSSSFSSDFNALPSFQTIVFILGRLVQNFDGNTNNGCPTNCH